MTIMLSRRSSVNICSCGGMSLLICCVCLRLHSSFLQIIKNFSLRQRLHFLLILLYGLHFLNIRHLMLKGLFAFLSVQMYLDNSVSFLFLWFWKDDVWFLYRSLKLVAVLRKFQSLCCL